MAFTGIQIQSGINIGAGISIGQSGGPPAPSGSVNMTGGGYTYYDSNSAFNYGTNDFTLEFFAKPVTGVSGFLRIGLGVRLNNSYSSLRVTDPNGTNHDYSITNIGGVWAHLAFARQGSTTRTFVNGTEVGSFADTINYSEGQPLIGIYFNYLTGNMTNIRIVKGTALYTSNFTPPASTLTAVSGTSFLLTMSSSGTLWTDSGPNSLVAAGTYGTYSSDSPFS